MSLVWIHTVDCPLRVDLSPVPASCPVTKILLPDCVAATGVVSFLQADTSTNKPIIAGGAGNSYLMVFL
jgi:hypothetical protein